MIVVLTTAFIAWRSVRPRCRPLLRLYAALGAAITIVGMAIQTAVFCPLSYTLMKEDIPLKAACFVAACLVAETLLGWRRPSPIASAHARQKRSESPATAPPLAGTM